LSPGRETCTVMWYAWTGRLPGLSVRCWAASAHKERSDVMSLGEIAYEAYHAALSEYRRTHHDHFVQSGRWATLSPQFQAAWEAASQAVAYAVAKRSREQTE